MKKLFLFVFILLPGFVLATSGACSSHGGVDCSAGRDWDGSVICNDGWTNSSVSYSSMVMCRGYSSVDSEVSYILHKMCVEKHGEYGFYYSETARCECAVGYDKNVATKDKCIPEQEAFQSLCIYKHGTAVSYNKESGSCECYRGYSKNVGTNNVCRPDGEASNALCENVFGVYARYNAGEDKCYCPDGFLFDSKTTKCVVGTDDVCKGLYGSAHYSRSENDCFCNDGYTYDSSIKYCTNVVKSQPVVPTATPLPSLPVKKVETPKPTVKTEVKKEVKVVPEIEIAEPTPLPVVPEAQVDVTVEVKPRWYNRVFKMFSGWFN